MKTNEEQMRREFEYRFEERLALLTDGRREPNKWERETAREEAFQAIEQIKVNENTEPND